LALANATEYKHVRLIGKSLGGIVASYFLKNIKEENNYSVIILGYVKTEGGVDINNFRGDITIIQGSKDKFGNIETIKEDLNNAISKNIRYFEIENADHSYRDPETKEAKYEDEVLKILSE